MPKIKDLGINIIPGTMRPPEIGGGGGCGRTPQMYGGPTDAECPTADPQHCCAQGTMRLWAVETDVPCVPVPTDAHECPTAAPNCKWYAQGQCGCTFLSPQVPTDPVCACVTMKREPFCPGGSKCTAGSLTIGVTPHTPRMPAGSLSREDIATLRTQLRQSMDNVDEAEKSLLPKTLEGVDAREKELQVEMEQLKARRNELKK